MYETRIKKLEEEHAELKSRLIDRMDHGATDEEIHDIKKQKLLIKDIIRELTNKDNEGREFK